MVNTTLIIFIVIAIVLLFTTMVLSAIASDKAKKDKKDGQKQCYKYSMWAALVTGIAVGVMAVILIVYIYSSKQDIASAAQKQLLAAHGALGGIAGVPMPQSAISASSQLMV